MNEKNKDISLPPSPMPKRDGNIMNTDTDLTICDPPIDSSSDSEITLKGNASSKTLTSNEKYELQVKERIG